MSHRSTPATIFLKQYGEKRTGTNLLRAMLLLNYANVTPLMHVLGDKHSVPVPLDDYWSRVKGSPDAAHQFVSRCTYDAPAETTCEQDDNQRRHLQELAAAIADSVDEGRLGFLISIKHPYAWIASLARFSRWTVHIAGGARVPPEAVPRVVAACRQFNDKYAAWLEWSRRHPERSCIVRYEDALADLPRAVTAIAEQFGLQRRQAEFQVPCRAVNPAHWDHCSVQLQHQRFDAGFYREQRFMTELSDPVRHAVDATIDWPLVARFGYPLPCAT